VTINERYPSEEYLRIYTDRSQSKTDGKAGDGSNRPSFDVEITAIAMVLQQLLLRPMAFKKVILLVGSKSAIQTVASNRPNPNSKRSKNNNKIPQQKGQDSRLSVGPLSRRNPRQRNS
jgi:hypothetical protein